MNRSLASAPLRAARRFSAVSSPASMAARAFVPASTTWESSRSSWAVSRGTRPISLRY